ncbi:MAG: replication-relaxation family protein [Micrococcales bacterium]|nr:replication-relaxation family protein [Micrococcales bacterium]
MNGHLDSTPRTGSIAHLLQELTPRDLAILSTVAAHRFVLARHLRALHFGRHATELAATRAAARTLKRLVDLEVLTRIDRRIGGVRAGSSGYVYAIGRRGRLIYARRTGQALPRLAASPSLTFLAHTLAVADLHARLAETARSGAIRLLRFTPEPDCWRTHLNQFGVATRLKPDAYAETASVINQGEEQYEDLWFIEVDRGTEAVSTLAAKAKAYQSYYNTGQEQATQGAFPLVAWIVPDEARAELVLRAIHSTPRADKRLHWAGTAKQFIEKITKGDTP